MDTKNQVGPSRDTGTRQRRQDWWWYLTTQQLWVYIRLKYTPVYMRRSSSTYLTTQGSTYRPSSISQGFSITLSYSLFRGYHRYLGFSLWKIFVPRSSSLSFSEHLDQQAPNFFWLCTWSVKKFWICTPMYVYLSMNYLHMLLYYILYKAYTKIDIYKG